MFKRKKASEKMKVQCINFALLNQTISPKQPTQKGLSMYINFYKLKKEVTYTILWGIHP